MTWLMIKKEVSGGTEGEEMIEQIGLLLFVC